MASVQFGGADLGELDGELVADLVPGRDLAAASGWATTVRNTAATMSLWDFGAPGEEVADEVHPADSHCQPLLWGAMWQRLVLGMRKCGGVLAVVKAKP